MIDAIVQVVILVTSGAAIWLINDPLPDRRRLGRWIGIVGQPAWFYTAWSAGQWGVFALAIVFTVSYARGLWMERE